MRIYLARCTLVICLLALLGCTSLRVVAAAGASGGTMSPWWSQTLALNDALTLTRTDGTRVSLRLTQVSPSSIEGIDDRSSMRVEVPLSQVTLIERREFDGVKTAFLVTAIAVGVYTVAKAVAEASLVSGI